MKEDKVTVDYQIVALAGQDADTTGASLCRFALRNWLIVILGTIVLFFPLLSTHPLLALSLILIPALTARLAGKLLEKGRLQQSEKLCLGLLRYSRIFGLGSAIASVDCFLTYQNCLYRQARHTDVELINKRAGYLASFPVPKRVPDDITSLNHLGMVFCAQGKYKEAEQCSRRAIQLAGIDFLKLDTAMRVALLDTLAWIYVSSGQFLEAEAVLLEAGKICEKRSPRHRDRGHILVMMAQCAIASNDLDLAEDCLEAAQALGEDHFNRDDPYIGCGYDVLGQLRMRQGRVEEAEMYFQNALSLKEMLLTHIHPEIAVSLRKCAELFKATGREAKALEFELRAEEIDTLYQESEAHRRSTLSFELAPRTLPLRAD
ncbi:MAG: tetratricopeptide repeat protein [Cyanobacteria bacterium]|nr:tetratricopeptide repeat protein [Cyanobacteriota bacterium]